MKARGADGAGSPLVVRGRDSNRSVFTDSLLHTLLEGEKCALTVRISIQKLPNLRRK